MARFLVEVYNAIISRVKHKRGKLPLVVSSNIVVSASKKPAAGVAAAIEACVSPKIAAGFASAAA